MEKTIKLSPSTLNLMLDCERCFWLQIMKGIRRPQGPMASIAIAMDSILKHYFEHFRQLNKLPPLLDGKIKGSLPKEMPKTLYYENGEVKLYGRPDEYLELPKGEIVPFDHKTKSKPPENTHKAYQLQMDVYSFLLEANKYKTTNKAYLAYYYPEKCMVHEGMDVKVHIMEVVTNPKRVDKLLKQASDVLSMEDDVNPGSNCQFCSWAKGVNGG